MPIKILMPALSPTMTEGTLAKWLKKEGDKIKSGDVIAEVETDKATIEYESTEEGTLAKILIQNGTESVKVNDVIAVLLEDGETQQDLDSFLTNLNTTTPKPTEANTNTVAKTTATPTTKSTPSTNNSTTSTPTTNQNTNKEPTPVSTNKNTTKTFITPLAKRIATEKNIDVTSIKGTGPHGRIIKADVENPTATTSQATTNSSISNSMQAANVNITTPSAYEDKPNSGMRKTIAKRLLESKTTIPHYYLTLECNMTAILAAREFLNKKGKDKYKLSVNDFIIKATALAMIDVPEANAYWQGDTTRFFSSADVSVAVATPTGLITPIIRAADKKGLAQISTEMKDLASRAKDGKLKPSEYQGGGFSVSNLGMFGIKHFAAIVNPPQAGIIAVGATEQKPIVKNGNIVIADIMCATLSADHRILDGAVGAKFLKAFKEYIENPISMSL